MGQDILLLSNKEDLQEYSYNSTFEINIRQKYYVRVIIENDFSKYLKINSTNYV